MAGITFKLHAAGVLAPGLTSLAQLRAICRGDEAWTEAPLQLPGPALLPSNERRRASQVTRLALACIAQALEASPFAAGTLRSVFATDEGTGDICQQMLESAATTRQISPLLFPNSVHNAPSGYFSIAWRNREPATVVSLGMQSFASGLLCAVTEAHASGQGVLLASYDPVMTSPLDELLPISQATASAWIISCGDAAGQAPVLGSFTLTLAPPGDQQASAMPSWLPGQWHGNSSARGMQALGLLEQESGGVCRLGLGGQLLCLERVGGAAA